MNDDIPLPPPPFHHLPPGDSTASGSGASGSGANGSGASGSGASGSGASGSGASGSGASGSGASGSGASGSAYTDTVSHVPVVGLCQTHMSTCLYPTICAHHSNWTPGTPLTEHRTPLLLWSNDLS
ncbi:hypothetical protein BU17DRAFT_97228 [Hysterangium stoloniferum]|nr:hypothetical protein BU17DRAFT_97228 [Hysterangium stoloniferum]